MLRKVCFGIVGFLLTFIDVDEMVYLMLMLYDVLILLFDLLSRQRFNLHTKLDCRLLHVIDSAEFAQLDCI